ncbi:hypothetical protein [Aliikangiella coralliicola]|uniref:Uncharacterized protein n=1 Tax=Aliikangiella coralliicola TaxID=2592383 RepID=A0A545UFQ3_9GAMM|nr:hypothetical protein [Aliikangiella coralliicola]TQV88275.1 hypothetical protein FLL46_07035 [Aliikangiella coralliicola]
MTKDEWFQCKSAPLMIEYLWTQEPYVSTAKKFEIYPNTEDWMAYLSVEMPLYKFYLSSCRKIWPLLTQEESRKGIELAEKFVEGKIQWDRVSEYSWHVEGAAYCFEDPPELEKINTWVKDVERDSLDLVNELRNKDIGVISTQKLLKQAAYFADHAMIYPSIQPKGLLNNEYNKFLCPKLLRKYVSYP